jgi:hypothetical protein
MIEWIEENMAKYDNTANNDGAEHHDDFNDADAAASAKLN